MAPSVQSNPEKENTKEGSTMEALQKRLKYQFRNRKLLQIALTHCSVSANANYEFLEFLGDRVLALVIGNHLIGSNNDSLAMRDLASRFNYLICHETLCAIAKKLQLSTNIIVQNAVDVVDSILADCLEAIIGAIYRDSGLEQAGTFILRHWRPYLVSQHKLCIDPKMQLQEWTQKRKLGLPHYQFLGENINEAGQREFTVLLEVAGQTSVQAKGSRKQRAEQEAARLFLAKISSHKDGNDHGK